jgi:hypothetical protein
LDIDSEQYAGLIVDLKNINTLGLNVANDWKRTYKSSNVSRTYHIGPAIAETDTFEYLPPLAIPQIADLGPDNQRAPGVLVNPAAKWTTAYYVQPKADESFYCYSSLYKSWPEKLHNAQKSEQDFSDLVHSTKDIQGLVEDFGRYRELKNFDRIYVGADTLAAWLMKMATQLYENENNVFPANERIFSGQIAYSFMLDIKPSVDLKFSYAAYVINPFVPDLSGGIEHSSQFSIYLNTLHSAVALSAKAGNTCNPNVPMHKCAVK